MKGWVKILVWAMKPLFTAAVDQVIGTYGDNQSLEGVTELLLSALDRVGKFPDTVLRSPPSQDSES